MTASTIPEVLALAAGKRVFCVGDLMLDNYVYGDVGRISPEAPIPILRKGEEREMLGAVGNVACNVASLGGEVMLLGVVGDDDVGRRLASLIAEEPGLNGDLITMRHRRTTLKTRFVANGQQLLRLDVEDSHEIEHHEEDELIRSIEDEVPKCDVVLLSDYSKGAVTQRVIEALLTSAEQHQKPVVADPKGLDFVKYGRVDLLKPNASELSAALNLPTDTDAEVEIALGAARTKFPAKAVLVTRSAKGLSFMDEQGVVRHIRSKPLEVYDVSGAGDTSLAALGLGIASGEGLAAACELALAASSVAVTKVGTASVYADEVLSFVNGRGSKFDASEKIVGLAYAIRHVDEWKDAGKKIGFTNGCFDILHAGHVSLLQDAKQRCDRLILGLNSDASVKRLKGEGRPVNSETDRAEVLAALAAVDLIVLFEEDTPFNLITELRPDLLVKGGDYKVEDIVGAAEVLEWGGDVYIAELVDGRSTTNIIARASKSKLD